MNEPVLMHVVGIMFASVAEFLEPGHVWSLRPELDATEGTNAWLHQHLTIPTYSTLVQGILA